MQINTINTAYTILQFGSGWEFDPACLLIVLKPLRLSGHRTLSLVNLDFLVSLLGSVYTALW